MQMPPPIDEHAVLRPEATPMDATSPPATHASDASPTKSRTSLARPESHGSFVSARDSKFWLAVAVSSGSLSSSSRHSSSLELNQSLLEPGEGLLRRDGSSNELDLGLSIDVEEDDEDDDAQDSEEDEDTPITSPPPPLEGLRRPTVLQNHRLRDRLNSDWRSSTSSTTTASSTTNEVHGVAKASPPRPSPISIRPPTIEPILTTAAPESSEFVTAVEEVYEHQRYQMVLGWGSKGHLLPLDPGKYVRIVRASQPGSNGRRRRPSLVALAIGSGDPVQATSSAVFPDVALPESPDGQHKWEWISPWHLDKRDDDESVDPDGWRYASSFNQFSSWRDNTIEGESGEDGSSTAQVNSRGRPKLYVRRRKWIRYRRLRLESGREDVDKDPSSTPSPFDDAFLDSMCGWLRKLGHVRKNWKLRYFVLEKSILRYYSDEAMTRLKGEVLLFHPSTRVHYVDIHLSDGRDNTFEIQVGPEYSLLLQAERLSDRENWMYCIEDALLCRDSYLQDPTRTQDVRDSVARRRKFSSESLLFSLGSDSIPVAPMSMLMFHSKEIVHVTRRNPLMMRLMIESDVYLESKDIKAQIATFLDKFNQKYGVNTSSSPIAAPPRSPTADERRASASTTSRRGSDATMLQDPRCLLALKNYRFFLERAMSEAMDHLHRLAFVNASVEVTSPRSQGQETNTSINDFRDSCETPPMSGDIDWELARKAVLYKLERLTFIPLQDTVYKLLESTVSAEDVSQFEANRKFLAKQSQSFFEIRRSHLSPSNWKSAGLLLDSMDDYSLPTEKASILLEVAKCIYDTYAKEHSVDDIQMMAADDFLPIFIFVLARSKLRNVVIARHLISETMISCVMIGETGYYATMFEAAMSYIASFHLAEQVETPPKTEAIQLAF